MQLQHLLLIGRIGRRRRPHVMNCIFLSLWCISNGLQITNTVPSDSTGADDVLLRHAQQQQQQEQSGKSIPMVSVAGASGGGGSSSAGEFIPWVSLQPARIAYVGSGTLLDKRHRAWQHWAVITFSCLTALVIASHVIVCVRSLCFESPGYGDHKQLASTEEGGGGGLSSTQGGGSSGGGGGGGGPRQHLQFDRFIINQGPESGYHMSQSVDGPKPDTIGRFHYMPDKGGGYHRAGYGMRDIIEDLSSDDYDSGEDDSSHSSGHGDDDTRHPAAGEIYFGLDGRARVVQYPQALLIPEEDETPEEFAVRRKKEKERAHYAADTTGPPRPWSRRR